MITTTALPNGRIQVVTEQASADMNPQVLSILELIAEAMSREALHAEGVPGADPRPWSEALCDDQVALLIILNELIDRSMGDLRERLAHPTH